MSYLERTGNFMSYTYMKSGEILEMNIPWVNSQRIYQEPLL